MSKSERRKQRQRTIKPLVDEFFAWAKDAVLKVPDESATGRGLQYCINQEQFLRVFLKNGDVPMDNNLRLLDYFEYLLSKMAKHSKDEDHLYIQDLLPWSKKTPKGIPDRFQSKKIYYQSTINQIY